MIANMEFVYFVLKVLLLVSTGTILLRISGRKSISQMTMAQTVIMISIGSLIIQPIIEKSLIRTVGAATIFILFLMVIEWFEIKSNTFESFITGKAKVVIREGQLVVENLRKLKLTVDQLEIRLRQQGIGNIADVKTATLEPNGQLGYELLRHAKPLTVGEFEQMMSSFISVNNQQEKTPGNLFNEVLIANDKQKNNQNLRQ